LKILSRHVVRQWLLKHRRKFIRIYIYGKHSPDWMRALAPDAPVWRELLGQREIVVEQIADGEIPPTKRGELVVVIPLMEDHVADCLNKYANYVGLFPSAHALQTLRDKAKFASYLTSNNLTHLAPQSYSNDSEIVFPCVLKRADLYASVGVVIVSSVQELQRYKTKHPWSGQPFVLQSLIAGRYDYVTHCICLSGRIMWHCSFEYDLGAENVVRDPWRKPKLFRASELHIAAIEALLTPLSFSGPCNVDYKIIADKKIVVLEINPRLGGSLMRPEHVDYLKEALRCIVTTALSCAEKSALTAQRQ
jgi:hypothetical protein